MNSDVVYYDRMGIVPSRGIIDISGYLREAEQKCRMLDKLQSSPNDLIKGNFRVETVSGENSEKFVHKFDTLPLPAIVAERKDFKKMYKSASLRYRLSYYVTLGRADGTVVYPDKTVRLKVPIIVDTHKKDELENRIIHETVHSVRSQWKTFLGDARTRGLEETMAYIVDSSPQETAQLISILGTAYSSLAALLTAPILVLAITAYGYKSFGWVGGVLSAVSLPAFDLIRTVPKLRKAKKLMLKGFEEGVNLNYLFLRADVSEFNLKQRFEEQIARKQGVKWEVIRTRLGISKS